MKLYRYMIAAAAVAAMAVGGSSCTNLDETLYDQVNSGNYYNTQSDVIRAVFRPFEHGFWSICSRQVLNELSADQLITPTRDGWWDDGGKWRRLHYHQWNVEDGGDAQTEWNGCFQGIMQCNYVIEDLASLNAAQFGFTDVEFNNLSAQCRVLRAWFYIRLLDAFRNIPLAVSYYKPELNTQEQVEPSVVFNFIEKELRECLPLLITKDNLGGNANIQGQWTQAGAAALLVRLLLNARVYTGTDRYADCVPARARYYFGDTKAKAGDHNCKYAASPSYDLEGNLYQYELGMPVQNFRKYPGDERLKLYRNLGDNRREGMFLFGYLEYTDDSGQTKRVQAPEQPYDLYIRDAVGRFQSLAPDRWPADKTSTLQTGDHNSGWHFAKYPFYSDKDAGQMESDYTEIRLPEIVYSLAECYLRAGRKDDAAKLLNSVRRRNYPEANLPQVLYAPEGAAELSEAEMLAEWGREFFAEGRRRIDLIRFGKFSGGSWWDKRPDAGRHTEIFPIMRPILNSNPALKQNPGYNS